MQLPTIKDVSASNVMLLITLLHVVLNPMATLLTYSIANNQGSKFSNLMFYIAFCNGSSLCKFKMSKIKKVRASLLHVVLNPVATLLTYSIANNQACKCQ